MLKQLWQYHLNIEINDTDKHHCVQSTLLGQLDNSLYGQRNKNSLYMFINFYSAIPHNVFIACYFWFVKN